MADEPEWARDPDGVLERQAREDEEAGPYVSGCMSCLGPMLWVLTVLLISVVGTVIGRSCMGDDVRGQDGGTSR